MSSRLMPSAARRKSSDRLIPGSADTIASPHSRPLRSAWLESVQRYCRALKDDPSLIQVYYRLYRSYNRLGQKDKAQEAMKAFRVHQSGITVDPTRLTPD